MITANRKLHFWDSIAINIGIIVGVGIFRVPSDVASHIPSTPLILLAWSLGGCLTLLGVLCYAELSSRFPQTGGTYIYLREAFGEQLGFLFGWTEFAILRTASIAAVAYIFAEYFLQLVPLGERFAQGIAIAAIVVFAAVNIAGLRLGAGIQKFLSFLKVFSVLAMAALIFWFAPHRVDAASMTGAPSMSASWIGFAAAMIPILWAYGGWQESTFLTGEFHDTRKALPLSLIVGILMVAGLYLLVNGAYLHILSTADMAGRKAVASEIFGMLFGDAGRKIVSVAILISACGALNSTILTGGRIPYAVAQDVPCLTWFGAMSRRFDTPIGSLALIALWSIALVVWGNFEQLLYFSGFANWLFFTLVGLSALRLRRRSSSGNHFLMIGYPMVPILFSVCAGSLCVITVLHSLREALVGAGLILLGVPIYLLIRSRDIKR